MPLTTKIIVFILAGFAVAGAGLYGLYRGTDLFGQPQVAEQAAPQEDAAGSGDSVAEPAPRTAGEPVGDALAPTFDLVRVEPTGEIVAAGQAAAVAAVELMLADDVLARATANGAGEWALVTDRPLDPGSYELILRATGPDGEGDMVEGDRVTVVIEAPDRSPLVAVTRPGEPTEVLQRPEREDDADTGSATIVARDQTTGSQPPRSQAADGSPQSSDDVADAGESATDDQPGRTGEDAGASGVATAAGQQPGAAGSDLASADDTGGNGTSAGGTAAPGTSAPGASTSTAPGAGTTADDDVPPVEGSGDVSIETVEVEEPGTLMLGGRAEAGSAVRLYLNNEPLGDELAGEGGRWTATLAREMPPGRYEVRVDVVNAEGRVLARAEVKFDRIRLAVEGEEQPGGQTGGNVGTQSGSAVNIVARGTPGGQVAFGGAQGAEGDASVIMISRGDNLWRIARKIYGKGVRHTVIYEANKNQIRNPHRIYPGQVFTIPVLEDEAQPEG